MSQPESTPPPGAAPDPPPTAASEPPAAPGAAAPGPARSGWRATAAALVGGLLAAGLGWGLGESIVGLFAPETVDPVLGPTAGGASLAEIRLGMVLDATLTSAAQGALLGLLLGLAGGLAGGSARMAGLGAGVGLLLGGLIGSLSAFGLFTLYVNNVDPNANELLAPLATRSLLWGLMGGAGGLAFGLGLGKGPGALRTVVGGAVGGLMAALIYELGGALLFPMGKTSDPIAADANARLFAHGVLGLLAAIGAAKILTDPGESRPG